MVAQSDDLAYLNDYDLAALLCKRSVPVWVGIGHEKDRTILDEIAHRSFDTPSKVIAGIRNHIFELTQDVLNYLQRIQRLSQQQIQAYQNQNDQFLKLISKSGQQPDYGCAATSATDQGQYYQSGPAAYPAD